MVFSKRLELTVAQSKLNSVTQSLVRAATSPKYHAKVRRDIFGTQIYEFPFCRMYKKKAIRNGCRTRIELCKRCKTHQTAVAKSKSIWHTHTHTYTATMSVRQTITPTQTSYTPQAKNEHHATATTCYNQVASHSWFGRHTPPFAAVVN